MAKRQRPFTCQIGKSLLALRAASEMSQARVSVLMRGKGVAISRSTLSRVERGEADITLGVLSALCAIYGADVLGVMTGDLKAVAR